MRSLAPLLTVPLLVCTFAAVAEAQTYAYDAAGRLIRAAYANGTGTAYTYDNSGNLVSTTSISLPAAPFRVTAVRPTRGQVLLTWDAVPGATSGYVIMRRQQSSTTWTEIATVTSGLTFNDTVPDSSAEYLYRIAARGANGLSAYSRDIHPSSPEAAEVVIDAGGARRLLSPGQNPEVRAGYSRVAVEMGNTPYGIVVFRSTQNGVVVSEAGIPAAPPATRSRIFIDYRNAAGGADIRTGIAMVNAGTKPASLTFRLRTTEGTLVASGTGSLQPGKHLARFIEEFSGIAAGFVLPADFPSAIRFGTLDVESDQPVSVVALRMTLNQRGEILFTSTPVADLTAPGASGPVHFPHFVDGGGFTTALVLLNTASSQQEGTIEFRGTDGTPYTVTTAGGQTASSFPYSIVPGGAFILESLGVNSGVVVGSIRVTPAPNSTSPFGSGVFRLVQGGFVVSESGIPSAAPTTHARIYVDQTGGHDTGLALANPSDAAATFAVKAFQLDGRTAMGEGTITIGPRGQRAAFVRELIAGLPAGFSGVVDITSSTPFAPLVVRLLTNSRGESLLTTFPTADMTRPAPSPVIFPQIADGGGYQTELILISPHGQMSGIVRYFDSNGTPLNGAQIP